MTTSIALWRAGADLPPPAAPSPGRRRALGRLSQLGVAAGSLAPPAWLTGCAQLGGPAAGGGAAALAAMPPLPALTPAQGFRLVNRLSWGANEAELARLASLGPTAYVQGQLLASGPAALPAPVQAQIDALRISRQGLLPLVLEVDATRRRGDSGGTEADRATARQAYQRQLTELAREASARHLWRALHSPQQLREQLTWFWVNHFNVHQFKGQVRAMVGDYEERALRPQALGRFRDLLGAATVHPAMLSYLDNQQNAVNRLNENHARELLELHTLGVDGGYSQADVQALTRVLTGHGLNFTEVAPRLKPEWQPLLRRDGAYEFNPNRHDFSDKSVLGTPVPGRGAAELDQVLDLLARHPATARHVSRKLAQYLLGDGVPPALVERMAQAFLRSDGHIGTTLAVLVAAPEFVAESAQPFKDPMHFVVSAVRGAYGPDQPVLNTGPMQGWLFRLGQGLYNRQTPDGYPLAAEGWTGSGQMAARFEIARAIGSGTPALFKPDEGSQAGAATAMVMATPMVTATAASALPIAAPARPPTPQLARPAVQQVVQGLLRPGTLSVLAAAAGPVEWNMLYLASPEFMVR